MIRIAICDDEPVAIKELSEIVETYSADSKVQIESIGYSCGEQLLADIASGSNIFDIVFLDINMHNLNGIETARVIRESNEEVSIIFVSALAEYVFDAFDVQASGFIIKPAGKAKIYEILDKSISKINSKNAERLNIFANGELKKIPFNEIYYCEVSGHSVFVYESLAINKYPGTIDELERLLPNEDFYRCHRSYIVNMRYVDGYKDNIIYMPSGEKIPVAGRRQKGFTRALLHFQRKEVR